MDDLVLQSERLAMQLDRDLEMPRIKRNLSQILYAGNQLWNRTVGTSANREASEVRASILLGARGYDYQKVSRNLDNLVTRTLKHSGFMTNQAMQPTLRETDIKGFVKYERECTIMKIIGETKASIKDQVEKQYWDIVQGSWRADKLDLLNTISSVDLESSQDLTKVAADCEQGGQFEDAVKLYDSISNYKKVLQILNMLLSEVLPQVNTEGSERSKLESLAFEIANRYSEPHIDVPREIAGTFYLLLDLMTFFNYYHANQYNEALDTIQKLKILPLNQNEVETKSRDFNRYPEEIRHNIPDILTAAINILYNAYKEQPSADIKQKAKALITFSSLIHYRLPKDTVARVIELKVLIN